MKGQLVVIKPTNDRTGKLLAIRIRGEKDFLFYADYVHRPPVIWPNITESNKDRIILELELGGVEVPDELVDQIRKYSELKDVLSEPQGENQKFWNEIYSQHEKILED